MPKIFCSRVWMSTLLLVLLLGSSGCNTVKGVGEDLEAAGEGLEESAEESKRY